MMRFFIFFIFIFSLSPRVWAKGMPQVDTTGGQVVLQNDHLSIVFQNTDEFKLLRFSDNNGKVWTTRQEQDLMWQFAMLDQDSSLVAINSQNAQYKGAEVTESGNRKSLVFSWSYPLAQDVSGKIMMTVSLGRDDALSEWNIESEFPTGWLVDDLSFPVIALEKQNPSNLILPAGWGAAYDLNKITNETFLNRYPSSRATVQLMLINEDNHTFYFATHDTEANLKTFSARVKSDYVELSNAITPSSAWNVNGKFSLPWSASIGLSDSGWEEAVRTWYRPFTTETVWGGEIVDRQYPEWLLQSDLWLVGGHVNDAERERAKKAIDYFGTQTSFHWYYWHHSPFDTNYPEYLPAKEGFDQIVSEIQERGSHIMPYINGRLWDTTTVSYREDGGRLATVINKDKTPFVEVYASKAPNAVICPTSPIWKEKMVELTDQIQGDVIGADAVYFDQVASARGLPCWGENHNHPSGGGSFWVDAYRDIFSSVRNVLRPGNIISTEQNAEPYLDMFDLFLMVNYPQGNEFRPVPLFPIIYADRALLYGFYIYNHNNLSYRLKSALTLLWGAQLNGGRIEFVQSSGMTENAAFLKQLATFRKQHHDLFIGGCLIKEITPEGDNPIIDIPNWPTQASTSGRSHAVRGALWQGKDGQYTVLLVNIDEQSRQVNLPTIGNTIELEAGECVRIDIDTSQMNDIN